MDRYIGLDAHASSCTVAVVGPSGRRLQSQVLETNAGPDPFSQDDSEQTPTAMYTRYVHPAILAFVVPVMKWIATRT